MESMNILVCLLVLIYATSTFQRFMVVINGLNGLNELTDVSAGNIVHILFSSLWEDHLLHIEQVIECLQKAGSTARPEKRGEVSLS